MIGASLEKDWRVQIVLFLECVFDIFIHVLLKNQFVLWYGFSKQLTKDIVLDLEMLFTGEYMPLVNFEMIVIKESEEFVEFLFIIQKGIENFFLLEKKLNWFEF